MRQCRVAVDSDEYNELCDLGWRVKQVHQGQALLVKGKATKAKARTILGRQCRTPDYSRGVGPDRYPNFTC